MGNTRSHKRLWSVLIAAGLVLGAAFGGFALLRGGSANDDSSWDSYRVERIRIIVHKTLRPCDEIVNADVEETAERVEITLHVDFGWVCAAAAADKTTRVTLSEPVGDRTV